MFLATIARKYSGIKIQLFIRVGGEGGWLVNCVDLIPVVCILGVPWHVVADTPSQFGVRASGLSGDAEEVTER